MMRSLAVIFTVLFSSILFNTWGQSRLELDDDSYVSFGNSSPLGLSTFTLEAWIMPTDFGDLCFGIHAVPIITKGRMEQEGNNKDMNYFLGLDTNRHLMADFEEGAFGTNPGLNHPITGATRLLLNTWYHVAATYDGANWKLYLNGNIDGELQVNQPVQNNSIQHAAIGTALNSQGIPNGFFEGEIDEVRIWNYARSKAEIQESINLEFTTAPAGIAGAWSMNEGAGQTINSNSIVAVPGNLIGNDWNWYSGNAPNNIVYFLPECEDNTDLLFSIGLIADPQYCDCPPNGIRHYKESKWKLAAAIDTFNTREVDFVISLGDIIEKFWFNFDSILPVYDQLNAPNYHLLGNHEFYGVPPNLKDSIYQRLSMPDYYYDFVHQGWRFIVLDATELSSYATADVHPELLGEYNDMLVSIANQPQNTPLNGGMGAAQLDWFRSRLDLAVANGEQVIVCDHIPMLPEPAIHNLYNNLEVKAIMDNYPNVVAHLSGHNHGGAYAQSNEKHYVTMDAMLHGQFTNSFGILNVYANRLELEGFGVVPTINMPYQQVNSVPVDISLSEIEINPLATYNDVAAIINTTDVDLPNDQHQYFLLSGQGSTDNDLFKIEGDSLLVATVNPLEENGYEIRVGVVDCAGDTLSKAFELDHQVTGIEYAIYPNPAADVVTIEASKGTIGSVRLVDNVGREVIHHRTDTKIFELNVSGFALGLYYLQVNEEYFKLVIR
jgi:manganese-dependent ADP-ribose/CDP-alcohol diphosphatase